MSNSVLYMSMSLDGFIAGPNDEPGNPGGDGFMRLQPADGAADRVIDPGHTAGADGDELLLRCRRPGARDECGPERGRDRGTGQMERHDFSSFLWPPEQAAVAQGPAAGRTTSIAAQASAKAASTASPSRPTMASIVSESTMKGGAINTWSPEMPSAVPWPG